MRNLIAVCLAALALGLASCSDAPVPQSPRQAYWVVDKTLDAVLGELQVYVGLPECGTPMSVGLACQSPKVATSLLDAADQVVNQMTLAASELSKPSVDGSAVERYLSVARLALESITVQLAAEAAAKGDKK